MLEQIVQEFMDIGCQIKKKDNSGNATADELKAEFENSIDMLSDPMASRDPLVDFVCIPREQEIPAIIKALDDYRAKVVLQCQTQQNDSQLNQLKEAPQLLCWFFILYS